MLTMFELTETTKFLIFTLFSTTLVLGNKCDCKKAESLSHPGCGIIPTSSTIINGNSTSYPWMAFLYNFGDTNNSFCGGILISDLQLLTAAHCVNGRTIDDVVVIIGSDNVEAELRNLNWMTLFKIDIYPLYYQNMDKAFKYSSDVAILTLGNICRICLLQRCSSTIPDVGLFSLCVSVLWSN